jgi:transposase InsO family protein
MNALYAIAGISKQGHFQAISRLKYLAQVAVLVLQLVVDLRVIHPRIGVRKLYHLLGFQEIGRDGLFDLLRTHNLLIKPLRSRIKTTWPHPSANFKNLVSGMTLSGINQVWVSDITYILLLGYPCYLHQIMDLYSRRIIGYCLSKTLRAEATIKMLRMALKTRGIKKYNQQLIHHSDRGSQYISTEYCKLLGQYEIRISMGKSALENAYSERVNGIIKNEYIYPRGSKYFKGLDKVTHQDIHSYNHLRPHGELGMMTPVSFEESLLAIPLHQRKLLKVFAFKERENQPIKLPKDSKMSNQLSLFDLENHHDSH